jgi:hypothetical protein
MPPPVQATLRVIYSYLSGLPREEAPTLDIPLHTVITTCRHMHAREHAHTHAQVIKIEWDGWRQYAEVRTKADLRATSDDGQACF